VSVIRPLGISDLPRLFLQSGKLTSNQAAPKEAMVSRRASGLRFRSLVKQWFSPGDSFHGWVCLEDDRYCGLVSVRERSGHPVWEIDRLLINELDENVSQAMFEAVGNTAAKLGVPKVFLRLPRDSSILDIAVKIGFCSYLEEKLFRSKGNSIGSKVAESSYRFEPCSEAEAQNLFHLYCQVVPAAVRCVEGMTLNEWQSCQESASGHRQQLTCWYEDNLVGLIRITIYGRVGVVELMAKANCLEVVLDFSLSCLCHKSYVNYIVPVYQNDLAVLLQERKFEPAGNYITLIQETASRVRQPQLAPLKV
jgi:hypothetical protein